MDFQPKPVTRTMKKTFIYAACLSGFEAFAFKVLFNKRVNLRTCDARLY